MHPAGSIATVKTIIYLDCYSLIILSGCIAVEFACSIFSFEMTKYGESKFIIVEFDFCLFEI
jgi:NADH:ubiquinone oxidoreductase subunit 4 (subunit M)